MNLRTDWRARTVNIIEYWTETTGDKAEIMKNVNIH